MKMVSMCLIIHGRLKMQPLPQQQQIKERVVKWENQKLLTLNHRIVLYSKYYV